MYRFKIEPEVSHFFRIYSVRLPVKAPKDGVHNPSFIDDQIQHIDRLLAMESPDLTEQIRTGLLEAKTSWNSVRSKPSSSPDSSSANRVPKVTFHFSEFCAQRDLIAPNHLVDDAKVASDHSAACHKAMADLPKNAPRWCASKLMSWRNEWRKISSRLQMDFGGTDDRKPPPQKYLAKKADKRAADSKKRTEMRGRSGK